MQFPSSDEFGNECDGFDDVTDIATQQQGESEVSTNPVAPPAPFAPAELPGVPRWVSLEDRLLDRTNFCESIIKYFTVFEVEIDASTSDAYRRAFNCSIAKESQNVVYMFRATREVPRLVGSSDILYIGQTKNSFSDRYGKFADKIGGLQRNKHAVEKYGPIRLSACKFHMLGRTLLEAENQLLWWYYQNHFEFPPFNYTKAKNPKALA